jgi:hypothetical protein
MVMVMAMVMMIRGGGENSSTEVVGSSSLCATQMQRKFEAIIPYSVEALCPFQAGSFPVV